MNKPTIVIVHKIKNRIRFKVSHPIINIENLKSELLKKEGLKSFEYNNITRSIVVLFDEDKVRDDEVILRIVALYSKDYNLTPIRFIYNTRGKNMPPMAYYSLATLAIGAASRYIPMNERIKDFINWAVVGTTLGAIGEHAYNEINEKGYFDPEVVSVMYLVNSITKGNFLLPSVVTWITTFGRHILEMSYGRMIITINEFKSKSSEEVFYDIKILPDNESFKKTNIMRTFLEKFIEGEGNTMRKSFMLTNNNIKNYEGSLFKGLDNGSSFMHTNEASIKNFKNAIN